MKVRDYLRDNGLLILSFAAALSLFALAMWLSIGPEGRPPSAGDWLYAALIACLCLAAGAGLDYFLRRRFFRALSIATERLRRNAGTAGAAGIDARDLDPDALRDGARGTPAIVARGLEAVESARRSEREAWRAQRQALLDSPAARIHELRTPLTALRLILRDTERRDFPEAVAAEVDRLDSLLEAALFESRAESFDRDYLIQELDVRRAVSGAAASLSRAFLAAGVSFSMEDFDLRALSDPKWLDFVLRQILLNALKYTPRGGRVTAGVHSRVAGDELSLRDTGPGIDPRDLPRIFDRGFTGQAARADSAPAAVGPRPTGMGLYLARSLCDKLGHGLSAESAPGEGTALLILFRRHSPYLDPAGSSPRLTKT